MERTFQRERNTKVSSRRSLVAMMGALVVLTASGSLRNWVYGQQRADAPISVACLGDSITYGFKVPDRATDNYPLALNGLLGGGYSVRNFGVVGATVILRPQQTYTDKPAFIQAQKTDPSIVIIMFGSNDSAFKFSTGSALSAQFMSGYKDLIAPFMRARPDAQVYVCLPPPIYAADGQQNAMLSSQVIPLIRQVAQETGAKVVDVNTPLSNHPEWFPDKLHPNSQGTGVMTRTIYQAVLEHISKK